MQKQRAMNRFTVYSVPNEGKGCLGRERWVFLYFEDKGLVLDYFAHEERDTLRQKFRPCSEYHRLSHNRNRDHQIAVVDEEHVIFPDWVKEEAKAQFVASIKVVKWGKQ